MEKEMVTLRELCEAAGVSRRAVQGYEKAGLVRPGGRNERGYLLYDEKAQLTVKRVRRWQRYGFSVREIAALPELSADDLYRELIRKRALLEKRHTELEETIADISRRIEEMGGSNKEDD